MDRNARENTDDKKLDEHNGSWHKDGRDKLIENEQMKKPLIRLPTQSTKIEKDDYFSKRDHINSFDCSQLLASIEMAPIMD